MEEQRDFSAEDLERIVAETKWTNKEAIRLFEKEVESLLPTGHPGESLLENDTAESNLRWVATHLHRVDNKLDKIDIEIEKWKQLKESLNAAALENIDIKKSHSEEKLRTVSLYHCLDVAILSQQSQESKILELKLKCRSLQREHRKIQNLNAESDGEMKKVQEKLRILNKKKEKRIRDAASSEVKVKKMKTDNDNNNNNNNSSSSSSSSSRPITHSSNSVINTSSPDNPDTNTSLFSTNTSPKKKIQSKSIPEHHLITAMNGDGNASLSSIFSTSADSGDYDTAAANPPNPSSVAISVPSVSISVPQGYTLIDVRTDQTDIDQEISDTNIITNTRPKKRVHSDGPSTTNSTASSNVHSTAPSDVEQKHLDQKNTVKADKIEKTDKIVKAEKTEKTEKVDKVDRIELAVAKQAAVAAAAVVKLKALNALVGRSVRKRFAGHGIFNGTIKAYKAPYFTVCYEDGDKEDMSELEVNRWILA